MYTPSNTSPFLETALSSSKKLCTSFTCSKVGGTLHAHVCACTLTPLRTETGIIFRSTEAAIIPKYIIARNYQHKHCQQGLLMSNPCTDKSCSTAGDRTLEAVSIKKLEQHVNQQGKQHQAQGNKVPCMTVMNCNHTWLLVCYVHVIITPNLHASLYYYKCMKVSTGSGVFQEWICASDGNICTTVCEC